MEEEIKTDDNKPKRDAKGRLLPGYTANLLGRPKFSLVSILKDEIQNIPEGEKVTRAISVIRKVLKQAEDGDRASQKLIMNYIEGMPRQNIGLDGGEDGLPVLIKVIKDERTDNSIT